MTKNKILDETFKDKTFNQILKKYFVNKSERTEFSHFLYLQLHQIDDNKITELWHKDQLIYFICGIIRNQVKSSSSQWHREYRLNNINLSDIVINSYIINEDHIVDDEIRVENSVKLKMIYDAINYHQTRDPYTKTEFDLLMMYYNGETFRDISTKTRIPLTSVFQYVKNAEILIRNYITQKRNKLR